MKITKKLLALVLVLTMTLGLGVTANAASDDKPILALGADLSTDQRAAVLGLLGVDESDLANYDVISITNAEEHQYLDAYLSSSVIGTHALSSVLIRPAEEGAGLNVTTYNISYCTIDMYTNALLTAGLQDANGTSALIGAVKGYADMTGTKVDEQALETAVNELVVTGDLGDQLGDSETASDMVAYIKQQILENNVKDDADIEKIIRDAMDKFNIKLTDDQVQQLIGLMNKISKLDIDTKQVGNFITRFFDKIMSLVNQFIG